MRKADWRSYDLTISTVGHSNRSIEAFIDILKAHGIGELIDIRTIPRSRHNPQFNRDALPASLQLDGIAYRHMPELGGLRHPHEDSKNTAWRNESFRGYADYMQTPGFSAAIDALIAAANGKHVAIMCAEAVEWRCHRSLVADALEVRGIDVEHIHDEGPAKPHRLTPFARVDGTTILYPGVA